MLTPQFNLPIHNELVVDLFAGGGGGASTGIEAAIGRSVDIAINHDEAAIAMHTANHPQTKHYCSDMVLCDGMNIKSIASGPEVPETCITEGGE
jgi:DNA (cytosine-5)-methyltransferase 1